MCDIVVLNVMDEKQRHSFNEKQTQNHKKQTFVSETAEREEECEREMGKNKSNRNREFTRN